MSSSNLDYTPREQLPLAPPSVDVSRLPKLLRDGDRALTAEKARETYLKTERASWNVDGRTSRHKRHCKGLYRRILEADRRLQERYEGLTTAKLTRGLARSDDVGDWLTLWELDEMLNGGEVRNQIRQSINYRLGKKGGFDFEWVAVTSVTQTTGTPREYIYLWIDDPDDKVTVQHLAPALEKHLKGCQNAHEEDHQFQESGTGGAITVEHTPPLVDYIPERFFDIQKESEAEPRPTTTGAAFVAQKLVHLPVGDYAKSNRKNPPDTLLEGAALAWASPYRWFRASRGVP